MNFLYIHSDKPIDSNEKTIHMVMHDYSTIDISDYEKLYMDTRNKDACFFENNDLVGYILGYTRDYTLPPSADITEHNISVALKVNNQEWPLNSDITGSFSLFSINKSNHQLTLCNDPIGIYPLYYYTLGSTTIIASSLMLMSHFTKNNLDDTGIVERILYGDHVNFGKRTLLSNVYRLLPGELITITNHVIQDKLYDNTLYNHVSKQTIPQTSQETWRIIKKDFDACLKPYQKVGVATSGGLDSRIILGAISREKSVHCMTYEGSHEDYETKVSAECAQTIDATFNSYSIYETQFPPKEKFIEYILETESVAVQEWLSIIENETDLADDSVMLIGDICDMLTSKHIKRYSSRKAKVKTFFKYLIWGKEHELTLNTPELFEQWSQSLKQNYMKQLHKIFAYKAPVSASMDTIIQNVMIDIDEILARIKAQDVKYYDQLDEIYSLYTHGRLTMAKQLLINKKRFLPLAPILSMQTARHATSIDPTRKLNFKLLDYMFKNEHDLMDLAKIPTAQVPFVPYTSNNLIKLFIWGMRSTTDQMLIRRQMKSKDLSKRQKILKSINWFHVYQQKNAREHLASYFDEDNYFRKAHCLKLFDDRMNMDSWPIYTLEIASLASLNLEMSLLKRMHE